MNKEKILTYEQAKSKINEFKERGLRIILALGIFDLVHFGHIEYLRAAKNAGDLLFVGVEQDLTARLNKGVKRPFHPLRERLDFLAEIESVDFVFSFNDIVQYSRDLDKYTQRYKDLSPTMVAVSSWDTNLEMKRNQTAEAGIGLVLISHGKRDSTTNLLKLIGYEI